MLLFCFFFFLHAYRQESQTRHVIVTPLCSSSAAVAYHRLALCHELKRAQWTCCLWPFLSLSFQMCRSSRLWLPHPFVCRSRYLTRCFHPTCWATETDKSRLTVFVKCGFKKSFTFLKNETNKHQVRFVRYFIWFFVKKQTKKQTNKRMHA